MKTAVDDQQHEPDVTKGGQTKPRGKTQKTNQPKGHPHYRCNIG